MKRKYTRSAEAVGQPFDRLTVKAVSRVAGKTLALCSCTCGKTVTVALNNLRSGNTRSCGCLFQEVVEAVNVTHGRFGTPAYNSWAQMIQRCGNKKRKDYKYYGGRGIRVCPRWRDSFEDFLADMDEPPTPQHSIDRLDNEDNYEPGNCRWATKTEQARNSRKARNLTFRNKTQSVAAWAEELGVGVDSLHQRLHRGWPIERVLTQPVRKVLTK